MQRERDEEIAPPNVIQLFRLKEIYRQITYETNFFVYKIPFIFIKLLQ